MYRSFIKIFGFFASGWLLAVILWIGLRTPGLVSTDDIHFDWTKSLIIGPPFVLLAGLLYGGIAFWVETKLYGAVSFKRLAFTVFSLQSVATLGLLLVGITMYMSATPQSTVTVKQAIMSTTALTFVFYSFFINIAIIFSRQASLMIGGKRFRQILTGAFYNPRNEYVAFLFMDLKSSVQTAQHLGAQKYSQFIQDCFKDGTAVEPFGAKIYQYIGDEVVLCWYIHPDDNLDQCILAWDAFTNKLKARYQHYSDTYRIIPVFRGGLHVGPVITAEIGVYKRDIAHHGHTINLAARVQESGKHLDQPLIITDDVFQKLSTPIQKRCTSYGESQLRNIDEPMVLYGL